MPESADDTQVFSKSFTRQEPLGDTAIEKALEVLRSGRLHRYNVGKDGISQTDLLETEFAQYMGSEYCLACASCGSAMYLALKSAGISCSNLG